MIRVDVFFLFARLYYYINDPSATNSTVKKKSKTKQNFKAAQNIYEGGGEARIHVMLQDYRD